MVVLYRYVECPQCGGHHHLWTDNDGIASVYQPHEFVCPSTEKRTTWVPDAFAELLEWPPKSAVYLMPSNAIHAV